MADMKTMEETYASALKGDTEAENVLLDFYEPYLIKLSRVPYYKENGDIGYFINDELYINLKLKLHSLLLDMVIGR